MHCDKEQICAKLGYSQEKFDLYINQLSDLSFFSKKKKIQKWNKLYLFYIDSRNLKKNQFTLLFEKVLCFLFFFSIISLFINLLVMDHSLLVSLFSIQFEIIGYLALMYIVIHFSVTIIHELAHGIFAINRNVMVPEFGLLIYYFSPAGFTDISEIYFLKNKKDKILCLISGLMVNFVLLVFSFLYYSLISPSTIAQIIFLSNLITIFFNLGYFIKLDGYYILQILLDETYLREKSINFIVKKKEKKKVSKKDLAIYYIVGGISLIFIPNLIITIVLSFFR